MLVTEWREQFATLQNERLREAGHSVQVDHRSLEAQGIEREATRHLGPTATAIERRTGQPSHKRQQHNEDALERLQRARDAGELERQGKEADRSIIDLVATLKRPSGRGQPSRSAKPASASRPNTSASSA